ncbi:MAG: leucine--tRNA ligase [Bacteroidales bacterium]|nr:leucine--tRNA ligase [Bacteroidales bacterium]
MEYNFQEIEKKWQKYWEENQVFEVEVDKNKPKFYILDMFPYPSGAGLHVGHPLGYIASDIYARYKRHKGFNVLHPMGYDAFGLPAEQYAIQTGQHPAKTTKTNSDRYREQLKKIGFCYDWSREVTTSDPDYYKWTQWIFLKLFQHWFNNKTQKAESIDNLIAEFEKNGTKNIEAACTKKLNITASEWKNKTEVEQQEILLNYRLAYRAKTMVNWCPELGTVLANDEVKEGLSVRGGFPVYQKEMDQWLLRVTAYSERLLNGLDELEWSYSLKEIQKNWIGKSEGAEVYFQIADSQEKILVFTTRPDTIYGATFMVVAPESELTQKLTTSEQKDEIEKYLEKVSKRTERERIADTKSITGVFTGSYAINPFTEEKIPIWTSDYVLAGYGTGAIMAVPAHDSRDYAFAKHFGLNIIQVVEGADITAESYDDKNGKMINSGIINGMEVKDGIKKIISEIEHRKLGERKINFRLRDAIFSRQRYWGEPFPIYYKNDVAYPVDEKYLPLLLPEIDNFTPTESGEPPLARAENWKTKDGFNFELSTMPGFAGSSAYYIRYMDPKNNEEFVKKENVSYWQNVDFYIGGIEHAVGHLIYSRFWNKFLKDLDVVTEEEPFKKLVNQGMIQGRSNFAYRIKGTNKFVSKGLKNDYDVTAIHADVNIVHNDILDTEAFKNYSPDYKDAEFILEDGKYICGWEIEKMSKSKYNVVNPDDIIEQYGADTLRLYEMFLGPIEQSKPWNTQGIEGIHRFLKKLWRLFFDKDGNLNLSNSEPTSDELMILHKTIKKVSEDIEKLSYNTAISEMMICVNELSNFKCNKRSILEGLITLLSPFAPHISEEIWQIMGNKNSLADIKYPEYDASKIIEIGYEYPIAINGKKRFTLDIIAGLDNKSIEKVVLEHEKTLSYLEGKQIIKVIVVPKRMVNIVVK